jgi:hypothetical protein
MDSDLLASEIGDEDFFEQLADWRPDADTGAREALDDSIARVRQNRAQRRGGKPGR